MRLALVVAAVGSATTVAHADTLAEFAPGRALQPAAQLVEASCDVQVELRGAIAEVEVRERFVNRGPTAVAGALELALPPGARMIDVAVKDERGTHAGLPVAAGFTSVVIDEDDVIGPDPAIAEAIAADDRGWPGVRVVLAPIGGEREATLTTRWVIAAAIHDGALHVELPGRGAGSRLAACRGTLHAVPGPGTAIARLRAGDVEIGGRDSAPFVIDTADVPLEVELAFAKPEPVVWEQSEPLGAGWTARAITVLAPPVRALSARKVLLVIDGSRSMELVGAPVVRQVVKAIGGALPQGTQVEAIVFDRSATRVLGAWQPADAAALGAIDAAIAKHATGNGSDLAGALAQARPIVLDGSNDQAMIVVITDGVLGGVPDAALVHALAANARFVDVHAIVLEPGTWHAASERALRAPVELYGGTYVEVPARDVGGALAALETWLRPSWLALELTGTTAAAPAALLAGTGVVRTTVTRSAARPVRLVGRGEPGVTVAARAAPGAPLAQLALAEATDEAFVAEKDGAAVRARLVARHAVVDADHAIAVVADTDKVARHRRAMIAGGGPFARMIAFDDPAWPPDVQLATAHTTGGSALDSSILKRLLNDQLQPRAYTCYQHALGRAPALAGTVTFELELGRGEVIAAKATGLGDSAFDACVLDAAYGLSPPLPNPDFNLDDRVIVTYPLTFSIRAEHPIIVAGDADSSTPLDIDAIRGGVPKPEKHAPVTPVDATTPLGNLRP